MDFGDAFWAGVGLAAAVATALATLVSLVFSTWWRRIDKNSPEWAFIDVESSWWATGRGDESGRPSANGLIANVGDGPAFAVSVHGVGCRVVLSQPGSTGRDPRTPTVIPVVRAGESHHITVYCEPTEWSKAELATVWREPGTWRRARRRMMERIPLRDLADRPTFSSESITAPTPEEPQPPVLPESLAPQHPIPTGSLVRRHIWWRRLRTRQ